jgi:hypothetical protein
MAEGGDISERHIAIAAKKFGKEISNVRTVVGAMKIWRNYPDIDPEGIDIQMPIRMEIKPHD